MTARLSLALLLSLAFAGRARSQELAEADALLAAGRVATAESILFQAANERPRDPEARLALGRYLGSRGALRVGAVLLEEARLFGADARRVATDLAPLYEALGDYRSLVTLPAAPLSAPQRAQAVWLVSHQPTLEMPDSMSIAYRAPNEAGTLGSVDLIVGGERFDATIDPHQHGVVIDMSLRGLAVELFPSAADTSLGALDQVQLGEGTLANVAVTFARLPSPTHAVIGLDVLARLAPTFDADRHRLVLRRGGRIAADRAGKRVPTLFLPDGVRVLRGGRFVVLGDADVQRVLRHRTWTLDVRRGELLLEP